MSFNARFDHYKELVENALAEVMPAEPLPQSEVFEAMQYSLDAGGKRIRPVLLLAFCDALGGNIRDAIPFAVALELIHTYSLIHDDLPCMDNDDMRRGKPSCHIQYGETVALLAGDGLLNLAFETMLPVCDTPAKVRAAGILARASGAYGMIGGQVLDLQVADHSVSEDRILKMYRMKTGELLAAACRMGACLAGCEEAKINLAGTYGYKVGISFQIVDDMLDIYGDEKTLGKPTGSDWDNHKLTFAALHSRDESVREAARLSEEAKNALKDCCPKDDFLPELTDRLLSRVK